MKIEIPFLHRLTCTLCGREDVWPTIYFDGPNEIISGRPADVAAVVNVDRDYTGPLGPVYAFRKAYKHDTFCPHCYRLDVNGQCAKPVLPTFGPCELDDAIRDGLMNVDEELVWDVIQKAADSVIAVNVDSTSCKSMSVRFNTFISTLMIFPEYDQNEELESLDDQKITKVIIDTGIDARARSQKEPLHYLTTRVTRADGIPGLDSATDLHDRGIVAIDRMRANVALMTFYHTLAVALKENSKKVA